MTTNQHFTEPEAFSALEAADVLRAASTLEPVGNDPERITVIVEDRAYDPLDLFARAVNLEPDHIRLTTALDVLARLSFKPAAENGPSPAAPPLTTELGPDENDSDDGGDENQPDITPALAQQMQRLRGEWVAVKRGELLGHAPKLRDLLAETSDRGASVLFVPLKDGHPGG